MSIKRAFFATPARTLLTVFLFAVFTGICVKGVNAWNSRITPAKIAAGKTLFERKWIQNDPLCGEGDGLGPVFNANSCVHCHFQGGTGGSGGDVGDVTAFTVVPHANSPVFVFGTVHAEAHKDTDLESRQALSAMYPTLKGEQTNVGGCFITLPDFNPVIFDNIDSPALFGIGKLDDVSNMTIAFHSAKRFATKVSQEFDGNFTGNGVGKSRKLAGGQIGKFGWK